MYLRCYYCGHAVPLPGGLDCFEGPMRCRVCRNVMTVRLESGYLRSMAPGGPTPIPERIPQPVQALACALRPETAEPPATGAGRRRTGQVPTEAAA
jgi:hypothetical protein